MKATIKISLEEVELTHNAEIGGTRVDLKMDGATQRAKLGVRKDKSDNLLIATLAYPRPGKPQVVYAKKLTLVSGEPKELGKANEPWKRLMFKEVIEGEAWLQVQIVDRDTASKIGGLVGGVVTPLIGLATGGVGGVLGTVLTAGFAEAQKLTEAVDEKRVDVLAETEILTLDAGNLPAGSVSKPLVVPQGPPPVVIARRQYKSLDRAKATVLAGPGDPNGRIRLNFEVL